MFAFIRVIAIAMIAIGVLSFLGVGLNYMFLESIPPMENYRQVEHGHKAWIVSCWSYGWAFVWGGLVLLSLQTKLPSVGG